MRAKARIHVQTNPMAFHLRPLVREAGGQSFDFGESLPILTSSFAGRLRTGLFEVEPVATADFRMPILCSTNVINVSESEVGMASCTTTVTKCSTSDADRYRIVTIMLSDRFRPNETEADNYFHAVVVLKEPPAGP